ncbi:MAG: hypothetical protein ACQEQF_00525 [Bacillota bacterium]
MEKDLDRFRPNNHFALYKGDKLITIGNIWDIAEHQGVKVSTAKVWAMKSHRERATWGMKVLIPCD